MASPIQPEEHHISADQLLARAKDLIHQGNVRRLIVKNDQGHTVIEIPLTMGVVGAVLSPAWAAMARLHRRRSRATAGRQRNRRSDVASLIWRRSPRCARAAR